MSSGASSRALQRLGGAAMLLPWLCTLGFATAGEAGPPDGLRYDGVWYPFHPEALAQPPPFASPLASIPESPGLEVLTVTLDGRWFLVPVTVENGEPLHDGQGQSWGKGKQTDVDALDFPTLARTGLHAEAELDSTARITGLPVADITRRARPGAFSNAGFLAADEDLLSALRGDNEFVRRLGLTHPQCAAPLFHAFNAILHVKRYRVLANEGGFLYNGRRVSLSCARTRGWQESIFADEILGSWNIEIRRDLDPQERAYLAGRYPGLAPSQMAELESKLSRIGTGEMVPYYIMRYGFYEGHTSYRADPLAIAFIFGLRTLAEIDAAFAGDLHGVLTRHFDAEVDVGR